MPEIRFGIYFSAILGYKQNFLLGDNLVFSIEFTCFSNLFGIKGGVYLLFILDLVNVFFLQLWMGVWMYAFLYFKC
jgi:hypothetical protein